MTVDEILAQAEELGNLIRETEIYRNYIRMSEKLKASAESYKILEDYVNRSREMQERRDAGDIIEKFEENDLQELADMVSGDETAMDFLAAQQKYLDLLLLIQQEISGPDQAPGSF